MPSDAPLNCDYRTADRQKNLSERFISATTYDCQMSDPGAEREVRRAPFPIFALCGRMRSNTTPEEPMRADQVEISWNEAKSSWQVRIVAGEEAIRRHSDLPKSVDDASLRSAAEKIVKDEGYEMDTAAITIRR